MAYYTVGDVGLILAPGLGGARWVDLAAPGGGDGTPVGGKTLDVFAHYNSLHNHAAGAATPSTNVGNWVKRFSDQAPNGGNVYTCGAQFGFFPDWTLPPRSTAGQSETTTPYVDQYVASWTNAQQVEVIEFVPDNFDGVGFDPAAVTNMGAAYQTVLLSLIDQWEANAVNANRRYIIYAGWNQLNGFGGSGDDPTTVPPSGFTDWVTFGLGTYQTWMELLVSRLQGLRQALDIRLHNISKAVLTTFRDTTVSTIPVTSLFEDLAPHGRPTWYFLAAVAEYIELFDEKPPVGFVFDPGWGVHATVTSNYQSIVDFIWGVLRP